MPVFTFHIPPDLVASGVQSSDDLDRFKVVPETFSFFAFVVPVIWLAYKRLWIPLAFWLVCTGVLTFTVKSIGGGWFFFLAAGLLCNAWLSVTAYDIERWALDRAGWYFAGVVVASNLVEAERLFFENRVSLYSKS